MVGDKVFKCSFRFYEKGSSVVGSRERWKSDFVTIAVATSILMKGAIFRFKVRFKQAAGAV